MNEQEIRKIYNGFEKKDMPFAEFRDAMQGLTSQAGIQKDLMDIQLLKAKQRTNKIRIDKANTGE